MLLFGKFSGPGLESREGRTRISSLQMFPICCQSVISILVEFHNEANTALH